MTKRNMTLIGFGKMGKVYAEIFADDFQVSIVSTRNISKEAHMVGARQAEDFRAAIEQADYIAIATPLSALPEIVDRINSFVRQDTVVFDICSVKMKAMEKLSGLTCRYFGSHMLSPGLMVVCGDVPAEIKECLDRKEIDIRPMSPEEHDRLNAIVGMGHFLALALANEFTSYEKSILSEVASGKKLLSLIAHVSANVPVTFQETQADNPFTAENRKRIIQTLQNYDQQMDSKE